ncbi:unnamed protein product [Musa banksii]
MALSGRWMGPYSPMIRRRRSRRHCKLLSNESFSFFCVFCLIERNSSSSAVTSNRSLLAVDPNATCFGTSASLVSVLVLCSLCKRRTRKASTVFITLSSEEDNADAWSSLNSVGIIRFLICCWLTFTFHRSSDESCAVVGASTCAFRERNYDSCFLD